MNSESTNAWRRQLFVHIVPVTAAVLSQLDTCWPEQKCTAYIT
jgi:hypothetical protein